MSTQPPAPPARPEDNQQTVKVLGEAVDSQTLLQGRKAVSILHHGEVYRLQQTRQGKLILTK